ncbi:flagellar motor protein MotB [uncultured Oscillibacter sp.]|uniref:OmpA/MotB family protein n=1 Tax=uncultured Oscillibacter sp. TaxID=876091 RepID=UPI0025E3189B|nr:flagellar motor protein MotB [uncultured Oscillibacter sp.]
MKKHKGGGGASWMDTYGDMVTLLLCFFVLLYSMSTIDQQKWVQLVQSFNPDAIHEITENKGNNGQIADPTTPVDGDQSENNVTTQQQVDQALDQLYLDLQMYVAQQGAAENISVTKGGGYVFISFNDAVFFDGDSYVLRSDGEEVLDEVGEIIRKAAPAIDELRVLGHTAQGDPNKPNNPSTDRFLASNRATVVLVYLQEMNILDPARMISMGYGQFRPVAENDTREGRAKNRRVELIVTGLDIASTLGDGIEQYYTERGTQAPISAETRADGAAVG